MDDEDGEECMSQVSSPRQRSVILVENCDYIQKMVRQFLKSEAIEE